MHDSKSIYLYLSDPEYAYPGVAHIHVAPTAETLNMKLLSGFRP